MNAIGHRAKRASLIRNAWATRQILRSAITPAIKGWAAGYYVLCRRELRKMKRNNAVIDTAKDNQ